MNPFGKSLLAGLLAGLVGGLLGYGCAALFVKGDDPERIRASVMLGLAFLGGTLSCGIVAARLRPTRTIPTAVAAALAFEAILLIVARPGLNPRALAIAFGAAAVFAVIGALVGSPGK